MTFKEFGRKAAYISLTLLVYVIIMEIVERLTSVLLWFFLPYTHIPAWGVSVVAFPFVMFGMYKYDRWKESRHGTARARSRADDRR